MALIYLHMYLYFISVFPLTVGQLTITTTPAVIEAEITKSLTVTCRFPPVSTSGYHVFSLAIKKLSANSTFVQLASINKDTHPTPHIDALNYGISGSSGVIDSARVSFLTVEWLDPKVSESGTYQCKANVFNQVDDISVFTENKTVSFTQASINSVLHRLQELEAEINNKFNALESTVFKKSTFFNGHQYYLSLYEPHSAANAEMACEALGGYLAEVDSKNEIDFLLSLIELPVADNTSFLVGGTDEHLEGHWINRHSGTPLRYVSWREGQPDNFLYNGLHENCQAIEYSASRKEIGMNDINCFNSNVVDRFYFICEIEI